MLAQLYRFYLMGLFVGQCIFYLSFYLRDNSNIIDAKTGVQYDDPSFQFLFIIQHFFVFEEFSVKNKVCYRTWNLIQPSHF